MSIDRLERRLLEVLTELSLPVMPDYVDNLLSRTERMPQRPGWTFPERWIPLSTITAGLSLRRPMSLRPLIVLAIIAALVAGALLIAVASQNRLPPPFGPARNGLLISNDTSGNIVLIDPVTNATRTLVAGPNLCCASFSPDGRRIDYLRLRPDDPEGDPIALVIANLDGSTVSEVTGVPLVGLDHAEWSPAGDKELLTSSHSAYVVDTATGKATHLSTPGALQRASWIGATGDILMTSLINVDAGPGYSYQTMRVSRLAAGATEPTTVTEIEDVVTAPEVSPDGSKFMYFVWGREVRLQGRVHVFDLATGTDIAVTPEDEASNSTLHEVEDPHWSEDSSVFSAVWLFEAYNQVGITSAVTGETVFVGPRFQGGAVDRRFSPDAKSLLVSYEEGDATWLLPVDGSPGRQVPWELDPNWSWQRLAP